MIDPPFDMDAFCADPDHAALTVCTTHRIRAALAELGESMLVAWADIFESIGTMAPAAKDDDDGR